MTYEIILDYEEVLKFKDEDFVALSNAHMGNPLLFLEQGIYPLRQKDYDIYKKFLFKNGKGKLPKNITHAYTVGTNANEETFPTSFYFNEEKVFKNEFVRNDESGHFSERLIAAGHYVFQVFTERLVKRKKAK